MKKFFKKISLSENFWKFFNSDRKKFRQNVLILHRVLKSAAHCERRSERRSQNCERERDRRSREKLTSASASAAQNISERYNWAPLGVLKLEDAALFRQFLKIFRNFNELWRIFSDKNCYLSVKKVLSKKIEKVSTKSTRNCQIKNELTKVWFWKRAQNERRSFD